MTEKNVTPEKFIYQIDALAFLTGFIGGPLLFTLCLFPLGSIPIYALLFGGPIYAIIGLPVALVHLRSNPGTPSALINLAIQSVLIISAPFALFSLAVGGIQGLSALAFFLVLCIVFAFGWAGCAGAIYNWLRSDQSRIPHRPNPHLGCLV